MNASSASSFDAGDYYKQLTSCLASKKNLKVNLNLIPGYQNHLNNRQANRKPLITRQKIQADFLAKCNARSKAAAEQASKETSSKSSDSGSKQSMGRKEKPALGFVVKGSGSRKRQDDYINLPDSFFKSFRPEDIPNLPIFKKPSAPTQKKQAQEAPPVNQSMITVASANFKPRPGATSTPHELPRPIISDPADLGHYFTNPKPILTAPVRTFRDKAKKVGEAFGKVAAKIDRVGLARHPDPLEQIRGELMKVYLQSCEQPRLINETLITVASAPEVPAKVEHQPLPPSTYVRPVPVFYNNEDKDEDIVMGPVSLSETAKLFESTIKPRKDWGASALKFEENLFSEYNNESTPVFTPAAPAKPFLQVPAWTNTNEKTPLPFNTQMSETDMLFGSPLKQHVPFNDFFSQNNDVFLNQWNQRITASPPAIDNTFALFKSPPKPAPRNTQKSQRDENEGSRDLQFQMRESQPEEFRFLNPTQASRRRDFTQRSQREDLRQSQLQVSDITLNDFNQRDSSLSTYRWTPNIGNNSFETQSSRSHHYPFERRNIFKNSFNF